MPSSTRRPPNGSPRSGPGTNGLLGQIHRAIDAGSLGETRTIDIEAITERAAHLSLDLKTLRQAAQGVWNQIGPEEEDFEVMPMLGRPEKRVAR